VSFALIVQALHALHYDVQWWHLNAADYGVPQTRRRLILVARRDGRVVRPAATHCQGGCNDMFGGLLPWVGWYEAIADLVDTLPESEFAPWQLARLPTDVRESVMVGGANTSETQAAPGVGVSVLNKPTRAVMASHSNRWRALLMDGQANSNGATCTSVSGGVPAFAVQDQTGARHAARAVLVGNGDTYRPVVSGNEPSPTQGASNGARALVPHRVVKMTPRALARFQSFPDWYELPERNALACKIIGNAVPPLLMRRVMEAQ
jgi:DNA (cytosine-5)-methyltransferase 1